MRRTLNLRSKLLSEELDGLLIGSSVNRQYLSGFRGSAGWLLITSSEAYLAVDFRYVEQASQEAHGFKIQHVKGDVFSWLPAFASELQLKRIGIESDHITLSLYHQLERACQAGTHRVALAPLSNMVESLRVSKDAEEMNSIRSACDIVSQALDFIRMRIVAGMSEIQVARELESQIRQLGSEALPFEIIVASGPNSALPHARPGNRLIQAGEPIIIDAGARVNGYCSDITRTFISGNEDRDFNNIYNIVMAAQGTALTMITPGMKASRVDELARSIIEQAGYAERFGHGLGHGIGLEPHEQPRLGMNSHDILEAGMVFSIEPGIYISGWGGVRIEDVVALEDGKLVQLTSASKIAHIEGG